jgi:hypothetical protein
VWPRDNDVNRHGASRLHRSVLNGTPELQFAITWPQQDFDRVWNLALSGHLKFAHTNLTKPHSTTAASASPSFSNELQEWGSFRVSVSVAST